MKIVIIEDELYTARDLESCILELRSNFEIVKILSSVKEAISYFKASKDYDLVFSDIQLGDGLSFEIYKTLDLSAPVIFCTAYNNYAIEAFKANGIDYVLKPISKESIKAAIEKYERLIQPRAGATESMQQMLQMIAEKTSEKPKSSLLVHHKDKIIPVRIDDIALFYIQHDTCRIISFEGKHFSISESLEKVEKIAGTNFFRANRQYLVNRKAISEVIQGFSRTHTLQLKVDFNEQIIISKEKSPVLFKWLAEV
jgi:two-component system, LytTR family, response regulator LytT